MSRKHVWSAPVALMIVVTALFFGGMTVMAEGEYTGTFGADDNLTWTLDPEGTLTITGTGSMGEMTYNGAPWYKYNADIKSVVIGNGVTDIGSYAFAYCSELTDVSIGTGVYFFGDDVFSNCCKLESITIPSNVQIIGYGSCQKLHRT